MQLTGSISQSTNYEAENCSPLQFYDEGLPCSPGFRLQPVAICRKVTWNAWFSLGSKSSCQQKKSL